LCSGIKNLPLLRSEMGRSEKFASIARTTNQQMVARSKAADEALQS
jgi:hypothetical protein